MALVAPLVILILCTALGGAQEAPERPSGGDRELLAGIRQLEEGDLEGASLVFDRVVRRLSMEPDRARELAEGYMYLGVAHVLLDQEKAGKATFREALKIDPALQVPAGVSSLKVLRVFEDARRESLRPLSEPSPAAAASAAAAPSKPVVSDKAIVYIYWPPQGNIFGSVPLIVDEVEVARVGHKEYAVAKLPPGRHVLRSKNKDGSITLGLAAGEEVYLRMRVDSGFAAAKVYYTRVSAEEAQEISRLDPVRAASVKVPTVVMAGAPFPYVERPGRE